MKQNSKGTSKRLDAQRLPEKSLDPLWGFLFHEIDTASDPTELRRLEELLDAILPVLEPSRDSIGQDLWLWIGLIHDAPNMAADYRQNFIDEYGDDLGLSGKTKRAHE